MHGRTVRNQFVNIILEFRVLIHCNTYVKTYGFRKFRASIQTVYCVPYSPPQCHAR
jgi:hypothetical protein